jgi:hypothetical protein
VTRDERSAPAISVVVATDVPETVADVLTRLRAQTLHERIELVIPTTRPEEVASAGLDDGRLATVRTVPVARLTPLAAARAAGIRAATARHVFIGETHSFPEPDMLEKLLAAHAAGWGRAAPVFTNANPTSACSWAAFLVDYGRFAAPAESAEATVPVYNCSYERAFLQDRGPALDRLIESGSTLDGDLRAAGCRSYRVGDASIAHLNVANRRAYVRQRYLIGRAIGARLARRWPAWRRAVYLVGSPLIPPLLAARVLRSPRMRARVRAAPRFTLTMMLLGFVCRGAGEAVSYAIGAGNAEAQLDEMEIQKRRYAAP